jgi:hypothetical protein
MDPARAFGGRRQIQPGAPNSDPVSVRGEGPPLVACPADARPALRESTCGSRSAWPLPTIDVP